MHRARFVLLSAAIGGLLFLYLDPFGIIWARNEPASDGRLSPAPGNGAADEGSIAQPPENPPGEGGASTEGFHGFHHDGVRAYGKFGDDFLRDRGENSYNLLAVFAATGDRKYLLRALERFPADPAVLYLGIANTLDGEDPSSLIERMKVADPNNPIPYLLSAEHLFKKSSLDAIAALEAAMERPAFYNYLTERAGAVRDLALYAGESAARAEFAGLCALELPELTAAMNAAHRLQSIIAEQDSGGRNGVRSAQLLYGLSRMFHTPGGSRTFMGHRIALNIEGKALQAAASLPANPLPIELQPRREQLAELEKEATFLSEQVLTREVPASLWNEYLQKIRLEGNLAALRWLARQREVER